MLDVAVPSSRKEGGCRQRSYIRGRSPGEGNRDGLASWPGKRREGDGDAHVYRLEAWEEEKGDGSGRETSSPGKRREIDGEILVHGDEARDEENGEDSGREASLPGKTREGNGEVHVYALESQTDSLGRFVPPSTSAPAEVSTPQPSTGATAVVLGDIRAIIIKPSVEKKEGGGGRQDEMAMARVLGSVSKIAWDGWGDGSLHW